MPNWTKEQLDAINKENTNIIVSAGAGSGKTAVLSERVLRKVKDNTHIDQLLLLTFTKAAAKEMKDRIKNKLLNEKMYDEVNMIDKAYITTFDSFSLSLVKKYHYKLNVSKNIKISNDVMLDIIKRDILDSIIEKKYKSKDDSFINLACNYSLKDDKELINVIMNLSNKLDLKYNKKAFLKEYINNYYNNEKIENDVTTFTNIINSKYNNLKNKILILKDMLNEKARKKLEEETNSINNKSNSYEDIAIIVNSITIPRTTKDYDLNAKILKDEIKSILDELKELCIYSSCDEMANEILETKSDAQVIVDILIQLDELYNKKRKELNLYNFNDIAFLAIDLVKNNKDVQEEIKNSFKEILIDEYQDTSDVQEELISLISNNNVYMVGDIKQSIYRFRNANPNIFKDKYNKYSNNNGGYKIDLNKNFRSRKEVINNINSLFESFMDLDIGGADYKSSHKAIFGNNIYDKYSDKQNYNISIYTYSKDEENIFSNTEKEIFIIGEDIKNKIQNKYQILDKNTGNLRNCRYSDFAILLDKKKNFELYKKVFEFLNIPLLVYKEEYINNTNDFLVIYNLLKLVINVCNNDFSTETKYSYVSVARSYLYNLDDNIIFDNIKSNEYKNSEIVKKSLSFKNIINSVTPKEFFKNVLKEFNYDEKILNTKDIIKKEKVIEYLYSLFEELEDANYDIEDILYYLNKVIENNYRISYDIELDNIDAVKIMSIHKSKGLEFPICYFTELDNTFNMQDIREKVLFNDQFGIMLPNIGDTVKKNIRSIMYKDMEQKEEIGEKIRLFYVALTRCMEHMIVVCKETEEENDYLFVPNYIRKKYNSFYSILKSIWPKLEQYKEEKEACYTREYLFNKDIKKYTNDNKNELKVNELLLNDEKLEENHFSKHTLIQLDKDTNELMKFGTKVHQVLEQIDFKCPNLNEIDNPYIKDKIIKFLNTDIISKNINEKFYKEYEFFYVKDNNTYHGIIDLMIENTDTIFIIDYKLKNINEDAYIKQLNGYKEYIQTISSKKVVTYLYSIIDNNYMEVK